MNLQTVCGRCGQPIVKWNYSMMLNPDGSVEVRLVCSRCNRKWYGVLGVPEDFEVIDDDETEKN